MKTLFSDLQTHYPNLSNYPKIILKINHLLTGLKIKAIERPTESFSTEEELIRDKLTIILCPKIDGDNRIRMDPQVEDVLSSRSHKIVKFDVSSSLDCKEIKLKENIAGTDHKFTVGKYIPKWNIIILYFNLFECDWNNFSEQTLVLIDQFYDQVKKFGLKRVDTTKEVERLKVESFMNHAKKALGTIDSSIHDENYHLQDSYKAITKRNRKIEVYFVQKEGLKKLIHSGSKQIIKQVNEIKALPFVKDIQVTFDGIMVYIGNIRLVYNKKSIDLGRFRIYLQPEKITIINLDAIRRSGSFYDSPHVSDGNPCYGGWGEKISELLAKLEFKKIVFLLKLILQKYNSESPHLSISDWNGLRKHQPIRLKDTLPEIGIPKDREYTNKIRAEDSKKNGKKEADVPFPVYSLAEVDDEDD